MMSISTNLTRVSVDGTDSQGRGGQDGSLADGAPNGFDDVLTQVNGPTTPTGGGATTPSQGFGTQGGGDGQTTVPGFPMRTIGSLADLLSQVTASASSDATSSPLQNGVIAFPNAGAGGLPMPAAGLRLAPVPAVPAPSLASVGSALKPTTALQPSPAGADMPAASSATPPKAAVKPLAPGPIGGQSAAIPVAAADAALVSSAVAQTVDVKPGGPKVGTIGSPATSTAKSSARPSALAAAVNPATVTDANAAMTAGAILAALLGIPSSPAAPQAASAAPTVPKPAAGATAPMQAPETDAEMPNSLASAGRAASSGDGGLDAMSSTNVDAQIASRPPAADRTPVSVVAQATFFPTVSRLSVAQQLADPIIDAARAASDVQVAASTTTIAPANAPIRTLDVTLSPGNLGSVTISMKLIDGSLHLGVAAQDAGTAQLIERDKGALAGALHASGYAVADLNIVHAAGAGAQTQSDGSHAGASQDQRNASGGHAASSEQGGSNDGGGNDQGFTRGRARPESAGPGSGVSDRSDGSVFL